MDLGALVDDIARPALDRLAADAAFGQELGRVARVAIRQPVLLQEFAAAFIAKAGPTSPSTHKARRMHTLPIEDYHALLGQEWVVADPTALGESVRPAARAKRLAILGVDATFCSRQRCAARGAAKAFLVI